MTPIGVTPDLTDDDLPKGITRGVIPIGAEAPRGEWGNTSRRGRASHGTCGKKYLYVWGRAEFKDGFNSDRHVNFCHRYPLAMKKPSRRVVDTVSRRSLLVIISTVIKQIDARRTQGRSLTLTPTLDVPTH